MVILVEASEFISSGTYGWKRLIAQPCDWDDIIAGNNESFSTRKSITMNEKDQDGNRAERILGRPNIRGRFACSFIG